MLIRNVWTLITGSGSIDESWFYLVSLVIEARSGILLRLFLETANAAADAAYEDVVHKLNAIVKEIETMKQILLRMYEENIPAVFYQRVRRYQSGWLNDAALPDGLCYGNETEGRKYAGGSNTQSPLLQALDIVLGIRHSKIRDDQDTGVESASHYLMEMRGHMLRDHHDCLQWLERNINLKELAQDPRAPAEVKDAYNGCVARLRELRDKHLIMVSNYILVQAQKTETRGSVKGTGGSNPIPFLKEVRSHMNNIKIE